MRICGVFFTFFSLYFRIFVRIIFAFFLGGYSKNIFVAFFRFIFAFFSLYFRFLFFAFFSLFVLLCFCFLLCFCMFICFYFAFFCTFFSQKKLFDGWPCMAAIAQHNIRVGSVPLFPMFNTTKGQQISHSKAQDICLQSTRLQSSSILQSTSSNKEATRNKCHASSNRCLTSSNKEANKQNCITPVAPTRSTAAEWRRCTKVKG